MKRILFAVVLLSIVAAGFQAVFAQSDEPTIYVIKKGDTLWDCRIGFLKTPIIGRTFGPAIRNRSPIRT